MPDYCTRLSHRFSRDESIDRLNRTVEKLGGTCALVGAWEDDTYVFSAKVQGIVLSGRLTAGKSPAARRPNTNHRAMHSLEYANSFMDERASRASHAGSFGGSREAQTTTMTEQLPRRNRPEADAVVDDSSHLSPTRFKWASVRYLTRCSGAMKCR